MQSLIAALRETPSFWDSKAPQGYPHARRDTKTPSAMTGYLLHAITLVMLVAGIDADCNRNVTRSAVSLNIVARTTIAALDATAEATYKAGIAAALDNTFPNPGISANDVVIIAKDEIVWHGYDLHNTDVSTKITTEVMVLYSGETQARSIIDGFASLTTANLGTQTGMNIDDIGEGTYSRVLTNGRDAASGCTSLFGASTEVTMSTAFKITVSMPVQSFDSDKQSAVMTGTADLLVVSDVSLVRLEHIQSSGSSTEVTVEIAADSESTARGRARYIASMSPAQLGASLGVNVLYIHLPEVRTLVHDPSVSGSASPSSATNAAGANDSNTTLLIGVVAGAGAAILLLIAVVVGLLRSPRFHRTMGGYRLNYVNDTKCNKRGRAAIGGTASSTSSGTQEIALPPLSPHNTDAPSQSGSGADSSSRSGRSMIVPGKGPTPMTV